MNSRVNTRVVSFVCLLVVVAIGGAAFSVGASPDSANPGQTANETKSGEAIATGVNSQGESLGSPVESSGTFDRRFYAEVSSVATAYNDERPDLGFAGRFARGNVINLHVTANDGEKAVVSFRLTEDNRIETVRAGARGDAKIRMTTDKATFDRIANADEPGEAFRRALENGDIRISGRTLFSSLVWMVLNLLRGIGGVF